MAFDYKKEYKEFYLPPKKPTIVEVPPMSYIAVRGQGDPNAANSEYKQSIPLWHGIAFSIAISKPGKDFTEVFYSFTWDIKKDINSSEQPEKL